MSNESSSRRRFERHWIVALLTAFQMFGTFGYAQTPSIAAPSAEALTETSALLYTPFNSANLAAEYWFEYGTASDFSFAARTPSRSAAAGRMTRTARELVEGLSPGMTCFYRLIVTTGATMTVGEAGSFIPRQPLVGVSTVGVKVGANEAALYGMVKPDGEVVQLHFQYGTDPNLETFSETPPVSVGAFSHPVHLEALVTDLSPVTWYYVRAVARKAEAVQHGRIVRFGTGTTDRGVVLSDASISYVPAPPRANWEQISSALQASIDGFHTYAGYWAWVRHPDDAAVLLTVNGLAPGTVHGVREERGIYDTYGQRPRLYTESKYLGYIVTPQTAPPGFPAPVTRNSSQVAAEDALLHGDVYAKAGASLFFEYGTDPLLEGAASTAEIQLQPGHWKEWWTPYEVRAPNLSSGATYYYRAVTRDADGVCHRGQVATFVTLPAPKFPSIGAIEAFDITSNGASFTAEYDPNGAATVTVGFYVDGIPTDVRWGVGGGNGARVFSSYANNLTANAMHAVSFFVEGWSSSGELIARVDSAVTNFRTMADLRPIVTTLAATNVMAGRCTLRAIVETGEPAGAFFRYWTQSGGGDAVDGPVQQITGNGVVEATITGLKAGAHYFQIVATNSHGTRIGTVLSFTTPPVQPPFTWMSETTNITSDSATLNARIDALGRSATVDFFVNGTFAGSVSTGPGATQAWLDVIGLDPGTSYAPTARITSEDGTGAGNELTGRFSTLQENRPPVARDYEIDVAIGGTKEFVVAPTDPDGDALTITVAQPGNGSVSVTPWQSGWLVTYTAGPTYGGVDLFTYTINDGRGGSNSGIVSIYNKVMRAAGNYDLPVSFISYYAGDLKLRLERTGSFTGKVTLFGAPFVLLGELDANGRAELLLDRHGAPPLRVELWVEVMHDDSILLALRVYADEFPDDYIAEGMPVAVPGTLEGTMGERFTVRTRNIHSVANTPHGDGFLVGRVTRKGLVRFSGKLSDGRPFHFGRRIQQNGEVGVGVAIRKGGRSYLIGSLSFANDSEGSVGGELIWTSFRTRHSYYQQELGGITNVVGKRYREPKKYRPAFSPRVDVTLHDDKPQMLGAQSLVLDLQDAANWRGFQAGVGLDIDRKTGFFRGKTRLTPGTPIRTFQGVIVPADGVGSGVFLMDGPVGRVELRGNN